MNMFKALLIAAGLFTASASAASAVTYANLVDYNQGSGITDPGRTIESNAYGAPNGTFLSLGLGGSAVFSFGTAFTGPSAIIEITNGDRSGYVETASVYGGVNYDPLVGDVSSFVWLGDIINTSATSIVNFIGIYNFLYILDTSSGAGRDGFDIDSISVAAVPVPAGVVLLGSGLVALGWLGRRRKQAIA